MHIPPALHHRRFLLLWLGLMISIAGSQMQVAALLWHIRSLTDQPIALGGIGLARILPVIVFSLVGGAVADAADRRKVLFLTQSVMALVALVLSLLTFIEQITLWQIYALTAIQAVAVSFDLPARQALVPNLVPANDLSNAFSLQSIASQAGTIVGPALGGLVIAYWGQPYTYLINAISFLAVLVALILIGPVAQQIHPMTSTNSIKFERPENPLHLFTHPIALFAVLRNYERGFIANVMEGVRFILSRPVIFSTMILDFVATFFASANTLMPIFARDVLHVDVVAYGWLSAAQSFGAVIAGLIVSQIDQIRRQGPVFLVSVVIFGLATIVFGLANSFILAMTILSFVGAADTVSTIIRNTIRQLQTPDYIRGRMTSINQIFFQGGPQLGEIEAGLVAQLFGAPFAIVSGGVGCIIAVGWIVRRWPQLRMYKGDEPALLEAL